ncbi:MAG: hypothetical protein OIF35_00335 [Cellvibrionaceae bacterium]|nr:hypothetical protein [Cellvibrionaceae bacterium]
MSELELFFKQYAQSFLTADAAFISSVYQFPMTFYTEAGEAVEFNEAEFSANSEKLITLYRELGVESVDFEIDDSYSISSCLNLVTIIWQFNNSKNVELYRATTRYLIRKTEQGLAIKTVFVIDEPEKIAELKSQQSQD